MDTNGTELETITPETQVRVMEPNSIAVMPGFNSQSSWELAQRIGKAFASSSLVPQAYQNNVANCIVALEMANRMGASPLMVMQNLYLVHGNPGWSSKFLIASFNQCGRFSSIRYDFNTERSSCRAWTTEKATGQKIEGPEITLEIAKKEGWSTKNGSKWQTMPELMLMYRAAAFLIRTYAPEISMGLQTAEEVEDVVAEVVPPAPRGIRYSNSQMAKASHRVANGEDVDEVLKFYPNMVSEQVDELKAIQVPA